MNILKIALGIAFMAASTFSFAGSPKGEAKPNAETTANKASNDELLYWFPTTADGNSLSVSGIPATQLPTEVGTCDGSQPQYCERGYSEDQTMISGSQRVIIVPVAASEGENHKE